MKLDKIAADLGVSLREGPLPPGWWGAYDHRTHTITLLPKLPPIQYRHTLAHELGHAYYRHPVSTPRNEWEASAWAAKQLITFESLMEAALGADTVTGIAAILEVMPADVETYAQCMSEYEAQKVMETLRSVKSC